MNNSYSFVATCKNGSLHGFINFESKSGLYSVKEDKFVYPDGSYSIKSLTIAPFRSLDEVVDYFSTVGYSLTFLIN